MTYSLKTLAAFAAALTLQGCGPVEDAFGAQVRAYLLKNPEILQEMAVALQEKQQAEMVRTAAAAIDRHRTQLERDPRDFVANPDGRITLVQFFDYRCGYCKLVAPEVIDLIRENPDVRVVFKEFPIFGGVSETAAKVALTPQAKPRTIELHQAMMADRGLDEAAIDRHLRDQGLDPAQVRKAAEDPAIQRQLLDSRALAQALGIEGTPAFIVGTTLVPGADMAAVRAAIAQTRAGELKRPGRPS